METGCVTLRLVVLAVAWACGTACCSDSGAAHTAPEDGPGDVASVADGRAPESRAQDAGRDPADAGFPHETAVVDIETQDMLSETEEAWSDTEEWEPLPPYTPTGFVGTDGIHFRDESGRVLLLRGVNVSNGSKSAPFFPSWFKEEHFSMLASRGHNVVRFLVIWEAIEPEEGVFDQDYLDKVEERVGWATEAGLYVVLDMHQDIWGPKFGGDGAPVWATSDHGLAFDPPPGHWFLKYGEPAVCQAFDALYQNEEGIRDHFIMAWQEVALRFADNPLIVGYDLINEPWFGSWDILDSEGFEKEVLTPFYALVAAGIRDVDENHMMFLEPTATKSLGYKGGLGPIDDEKVAYAPHYYNPSLEWFGEYLDEKGSIETVFQMLAQEAKAIGGPVFLGEWGFYVGAKDAHIYNRHQMELLEDFGFSTAAWSLDPGGGWFNLLNSQLEPRWSLELLSSPYPRRVNGRLVSWHYERADRTLSAVIDPTGWESGDTVFFVPETHYPYGLEVTCADGAPCPIQHDKQAQLLRLETADQAGKPVQVTVAPSQVHPRPAAGFSTHVSPTAGPSQTQELDMEQELGIEVIRRDFAWSKIEPANDQLAPEHYESLVDNALARGMDVVALLDYSVDWAEGEPGNCSTIDEGQFGDFAGAVAAYYSKRLLYYEIWNEQNTDRFWKPEPDPVHYGKLLKSAFKRIKEEDPTSVVMPGGLASLNIYFGLGWDFLGRLIAAHPDVGNYMDAVAIHPYTLVQTLPPEEENAGATYPQMLRMVRETLGDYGLEYLPIVVTEMGWPACPCPPLEPPPFTPNVTWEQQAWYLVRAYVLGAAAGLDMFLWYDFMDGAGGGELFSESYFGVVQHDPDAGDGVLPEVKPAFLAYRTLMLLVGDAWYGRDLSSGAHCHLHRFEGEDKRIYIAWSSDQALCQPQIPEPGQPDSVFDVYGEEVVPSDTAGPSPVYRVFSSFD